MNSPHEIEVALNAHYSPSSFEPKSSALHETLERFIALGIMEIKEKNAHGKTHFLTPKGTAWVKMICSTPFPEYSFINPLTKEPIQ